MTRETNGLLAVLIKSGLRPKDLGEVVELSYFKFERGFVCVDYHLGNAFGVKLFEDSDDSGFSDFEYANSYEEVLELVVTMAKKNNLGKELVHESRH